MTTHRLLLLTALLAATALVAACGASSDRPAPPTNPGHIHGLAVNPGDRMLYIATHAGVWRLPPGNVAAAVPVGGNHRDVRALAVDGRDRFLASGHPGRNEPAPASLGVQLSTDRGTSWKALALLGKSAFHVLRASGPRVYGTDGAGGAFLTSADGGRTWQQRQTPARLYDLAIAPDDPQRLVAASATGLIASTDAGQTWRRVNRTIAQTLAWPARDALYVVDTDMNASVSQDGGRTLFRNGTVPRMPRALVATNPEQLFATDGTTLILSDDGGRTWRTRWEPGDHVEGSAT
jgi:hypothetical protein